MEVRDTHINMQPTATVGGVKILGIAISSERHPLKAVVLNPDTIFWKV